MAKGDHIRVKRLGYYHHGIDIGDGKVVHYSKINAEAEVKETSLAEFLELELKNGKLENGKIELEIVEYIESLPTDEVVRKAKSREGTKKYNLIFNNCEHFASWCKTGMRISEQVDNAAVGVGVGGVVVAKTITPSFAKKIAVSAVVDYAFNAYLAYLQKSLFDDIEVNPYQKTGVIYCDSRGVCFYG
jgi:hypothetical protein